MIKSDCRTEFGAAVIFYSLKLSQEVLYPSIEKAHLLLCVEPVLTAGHYRHGSASTPRKFLNGIGGSQRVPLAV